MKFQISERRACRVVGQPRSCQRYVITLRTDEAPLVKRMLELVRKTTRFSLRDAKYKRCRRHAPS